MRIDWLDGRGLALDCPVCHSTALKPPLLSVGSPYPAQGRLTLIRCPGCGSAFYNDRTPPPYEGGDALATSALQFYVEQGAGIDAMLEPLFRFHPERIRHYLEVGCGFGYSLDFARFAFNWDARGVDPSSIAAAGREALKLDIIPAYLTRDTELGGTTFDLVLCSELIEHVPDPHDFLRVVGPALAADGALALTTPNAAAIRADTPSALLSAILSPGSHLVLYTKASLELLLRANGFTHVQAWDYRTSLHAVASFGPHPVRHPPVLDRVLYRRYLAERSATVPGNTPLALGFAYRLFKECVNAGDFEAAERAFDQLRAACAALYGLGLTAPQSIPPGSGFPPDLDNFARRCPFNLTGALYFQGIVEMNRHANYAVALDYFRAAARSGVAVRTALRSGGHDDGETEDLVWQARIHGIYCLARLDPVAALDAMKKLRGRPLSGDPAPELWQVPPRLVARAGVELLKILPEHLAQSARGLWLRR